MISLVDVLADVLKKYFEKNDFIFLEIIVLIQFIFIIFLLNKLFAKNKLFAERFSHQEEKFLAQLEKKDTEYYALLEKCFAIALNETKLIEEISKQFQFFKNESKGIFDAQKEFNLQQTNVIILINQILALIQSRKK